MPEERTSRVVLSASAPNDRRRRRRGGGDGGGDDALVAAAAANLSVRRAAFVGLLALPWALYTYSTVSNLSAGGISPHGRGRPRSRSLAAYQSCSLSVLRKPDRPVVPVYGASYPGSGSMTLHYLTEALTGLEAGDDSKDKADAYDKVLIRTHFPAWKREVGGDTRLMDRAILLIRNPLDALPGHASLYYEKVNKLRIDGEISATPEYWLEWRESHFDSEISKWSDHVSHWASRKPREKRLVVSYEHLVDEKRGMVEAGRVAAFLGRADGVEVVPNERVPCVWDKVVKFRSTEQRRRRTVQEKGEGKEEKKVPAANAKAGEKKGAGAGDSDKKARSLRAVSESEERRYEYTEEQLRTVMRTLEDLKEKFSEEYTLVVSLEEYREDCQRQLKKLGKSTKEVSAKKDGSK